MNIASSYGRWFRRRLAVLSLAMAAAVLLIAHLATVEDLRPSARIPLLAVAGLVAVLCLVVAFLTVGAHRLHRRGRRADARVLRGLLEPAERLVAPAVLLLLPLALAPAGFRLPEALPAPRLAFHPAPLPPVPPPPVTPLPPAAPEEVVETPAPLPEPPTPAAPALEAAQDAGSDNDVFRLLPHEPWALPKVELGRLGVPEDERPLEGRPITVEIEALILWEESRTEGSGVSLRIDVPIDGGPVLRLSTLYLGYQDGADLADGTPEIGLIHSTLETVFRIAGGTRHAALDLWLSVGLAVDSVDADGLDPGARLSPRIGLDLALWQTERMGFELHVGQSLPLPLAGNSAAVTEASAALRIDLSERLTLRAGWRLLAVRLRDYDEPFETEGVIAELDREFAGPFIGLELRF